FLGSPCGDLAHKYLHTHYFDKSNFFECDEELAKSTE
ncbi:iron hydrogenase small subunit, partial [Paraclostridium ghonii]|nr:hypothetical protein [Paeniclostridium ghonii]